MKDLSLLEIGDKFSVDCSKQDWNCFRLRGLVTLIWLSKKKKKNNLHRNFAFCRVLLCDLTVPAFSFTSKANLNVSCCWFRNFYSTAFPYFSTRTNSNENGGWLALIPAQRRSLINNPSESASGLWRFKKHQTKIHSNGFSGLIRVTQLGNEIRLRLFSFSFIPFSCSFRTEMGEPKRAARLAGANLKWDG